MRHKPVFKERIVEVLRDHFGEESEVLLADLTCGEGGIALHVLEKLPNVKLVCNDLSEKCVKEAAQNLPSERVAQFLSVSYHEVEGEYDAVLLDLGISFFHLESGRGFSYMNEEEPLDMRYSTKTRITAEEVLNNFPLQEIEAIIRVFGEEPCARNFVKVLGKARETRRIETVKDLLDLVRGARECASHFRKSSKRIFQALRIFVNQELEVLKRFLRKSHSLVKPGGLLMIITYHSLEDREVKNFFKSTPHFEIIKPFPMKPSEQEVEETPNARSAKLRVGKRR